MMTRWHDPNEARLNRLLRWAGLLVVLVFARVLWLILAAYRDYFPPNFDSSMFLSAHRGDFTGWYPIAFYAHIVAGPVALVQAAALMYVGLRPKPLPAWHRVIGRIQAGVVLLILVPSGVVMAQAALAGTSGVIAFTLLSIATGACMTMTVLHAVARRMMLHQIWATRCFVLLSSPLILRLAVGLSIVTGTETDAVHKVLAWASWLVPWLLFELGRESNERGWFRNQRREKVLHPVDSA